MTESANTPRLYITDKEVREILQISQPTLWRWTKELGFPQAIKGMKGRRPYREFIDWAKNNGMV
ncbi:helix-turn-helix transcriptional regulator [Vibrio cyclitrophicus]|jgi:predicted DNA-binding transcriptional regulator AlpA